MARRTHANAGVRLHADDRRHQLTALGLELFSRRPYDEVSVDEIAATAGIAKGLLYHYFPSKRDFYVATLQTAVEELLAGTRSDPSLPPLERLITGLDAYLDFVDRHAEIYLMVIQGGIGSDREVKDLVEGARDAFVVLVLSGVDGGRPRPALRLAVRGWIGFVEGCAADWLRRRDLDRERLRSLLVGVLVASLAQALEADPEIELGKAALADMAAQLGSRVGVPAS